MRYGLVAATRGAGFLFAASLAGCVVSVDAVIPSAGSIRDLRLVGTWKTSPADSDSVVASYGDSAYVIAYTASGKTGHFTARLGRLGRLTVLDVWPTPSDAEIPEQYKDLMLPGHYLLALDISPDSIRTRGVGSDTLRKALETHQVPLIHRRTRDRIVLLDTTAALRAKLLSYLGRPGALDEPTTWHRVRRR